MKNLEYLKIIVGAFAIMVITKVPLGLWSVASAPQPGAVFEIKAAAVVAAGVIIILMFGRTGGVKWRKQRRN